MVNFRSILQSYIKFVHEPVCCLENNIKLVYQLHIMLRNKYYFQSSKVLHFQQVWENLKIAPSQSVSLGTDPPPPTTQQFFLSSQALKNLRSTLRQTNSPDNSNMSHMFNNYTYTDFRTGCKYVLIFS